MKYCDQSKLISCFTMKFREILSKYSLSSIFLHNLIFSCYLAFICQLLSRNMKKMGKVCKKQSELISLHFTNDDEILSIANMDSLGRVCEIYVHHRHEVPAADSSDHQVFCKKWVSDLHMTSESKCIGQTFWPSWAK